MSAGSASTDMEGQLYSRKDMRKESHHRMEVGHGKGVGESWELALAWDWEGLTGDVTSDEKL